MAKLDTIKDDALRSRLEQAHDQLRSGQPTEAVHTLSDAFLDMLAKQPELLEETVELRAGNKIRAVLRWPALGANLSLDSVRAKQPRIEFTRERFSLSEAFTYYEFTVDTALRRGF